MLPQFYFFQSPRKFSFGYTGHLVMPLKIVANERVGMNLPDYDFNVFIGIFMAFPLLGEILVSILNSTSLSYSKPHLSSSAMVTLLISALSHNSSHAFFTSVKVLPFNEAFAINRGSFEISVSFKFIYFLTEKIWF